MKKGDALSLPKGWEMKKLGEVCRFINGRAYTQQELLKEGKYPVLRVGNFYTNRDWYFSDLELPEDKYCERGDLLYAWSASFGPRIWDGEKVIYHYHIWKVEPNEKLISKDFLFQILEWDTEAIKTAHGTGTTMMHVGKGSIENRLVPLPPLPEQQRIVAILDKVFSVIERCRNNVEQNLKNAKELFESVLNGQFTMDNGQLREGWEEKRLIDVCDLIMGQSPAGETYNTDGIGVPLINGPVEFGKEPFSETIKSKFTTEPTKFCNRGDLILCVRGSTTGRINLAGFEACIGRGVAAIRYTKNQYWLNYFILSSRKKIYDLGTGATFPNVSGEILKNLIIPIPPLKIQQAIVQKLDALSAETKKLENIYQQKLKDLEELKKSVLQKAFSGQLRIDNVQLTVDN